MESIESSTPQKDDPKTLTQTPTNNKSNNHPRRFTDEQTRSLESIFKHETKLEPGRKLQIARDLCLEPKQVAIWFQNKRARWKSKRMEREFRHLKSNYDALVVEVEGLKRDKDSLQMQLKELNGRRLKNGGTGRGDGVIVGGDDDGGIITRCGFGKNEDEEFVRWSSSGEEEEMSNLSLFDEDFKWWET